MLVVNRRVQDTGGVQSMRRWFLSELKGYVCANQPVAYTKGLLSVPTRHSTSRLPHLLNREQIFILYPCNKSSGTSAAFGPAVDLLNSTVLHQSPGHLSPVGPYTLYIVGTPFV